MRHCGAVLLVAVAAVVQSSCSSASPPKPRLVEAWKSSSITPIGQPVAIGESVVVYGTVGRELYLYGISVADGSIRWSQPATPSRTVTGSPLTPSVVEGHIAYFRPDVKTSSARLVVATPEDGKDALVSDPGVFRSQPGSCSDGKDVCVTGFDARGAEVGRRFSLEARGPVPDPAAPPVRSRYVGEDLLDLGEREPELLGGFRDGAVQWRAPLSRYFPPGYTTDHGWYFRLYEGEQLHVGSVGHPADQSDDSVAVVDLAKVQTSAIEATTGASAWRAEGTSFGCDAKIDLKRTVPGGRSEVWPVRCRYRGIARYDRKGAVSYQGLDVTLEGFDVRTGTTTWSVPLGAAEAFMDADAIPPTVSDSEVLVRGATGPMIVDLGSGRTRAPARGEAFWCQTEVGFDYHEPGATLGATTSTRRGGTVVDSCAAEGSHSPAVPGYVDGSLGARVGGRTVFATADGLVAYDPGRGSG